MTDRWQDARAQDIEKKLKASPVYAAVGTELREAMIAQEVMAVMGNVDWEPTITCARVGRLYRRICADLLPEKWKHEAEVRTDV